MSDMQAHPLSRGSGEREASRMQSNWDFAGQPVHVLFLCPHNQKMAEALTHRLSQGQVQTDSAGSQPSAEVHPLAVRAIARLGADMSRHVPKSLEQFRGKRFDRLIALCDPDQEACPALGEPSEILWTIPDPLLTEGTLEQRQQIKGPLAIELNTRIRLLLTLLEREKRVSV